jgi:hypothetical protein
MVITRSQAQNMAQPIVQAIPIFSLSPALYSNGVIDFNLAAGQKLYRQGIEKLQEELFNVDPSGIHSFLNALIDKGDTMGWSKLFNVPHDIAHPAANLIHMPTRYGEVTMAQIKAHVLTYVNLQERIAQDNMMMYTCLMNSLSPAGKNKITVYKSDYTVPSTAGTITSAMLLLKVVIRECHIDTRATVRHIRAKLSSLPSYLASIKNDITLFNHYVLELLQQLHARGETTHDLLANLFEAYKSVPDRDFSFLIKHKENQYDDGEDIDVYKLMQIAQQKYNTMKGDKTWNLPSKEQQQIIALESKLAELQKKPDKKSGKGSKKNTDSGKDGDDKKKTKKGGKNSNKEKPKPKWMSIAPKEEDMDTPRKYMDRNHWWCPHHKSYSNHRPDKCFLINQSPKTKKTAPKTQHPNAQLRLSGAMTRVVQFADEDDESE